MLVPMANQPPDRVFNRKQITVGKLQELMTKHLRPDDLLEPVEVGNLAVLRQGKYIGFIDIANETVELDVEDHG